MPILHEPETSAIDTTALLAALMALKKGDCSVRLPMHWTGVSGKVADTFNEVVELERAHGPGAGAPQPRRRQGGQAHPARSLGDVSGSWRDSVDLRQRADRRSRPPHQRNRPRHRRRRPGRPVADHGPRSRGSAAPGRVPAHRQDHQQDGRSARLVRLGSDARGARGRHRRQARRPGEGQGRGRHLEGPNRFRQLDGRQPHRPGPQHRRRDHRRRQRRPVEEDHRRRQGRVPRAEGHHQHDGRSAPFVRRRSDPRGPRGRHRRQARRPGATSKACPARGKT